MGTLFNLIIAAELVIVLVLLLSASCHLKRHWRTTLAGAFVLAVALLVNGVYLLRTGGFYDTIAFAQTIAIGIAFLLTADGHAD